MISDPARWITARHEAGHAVAMFAFGIYPDGASCRRESGVVHQFASAAQWADVGSDPELQRQQAVILMAGPVAEMIARGFDADEGLISGQTCDLEAIATYGFASESDRLSLQEEAAEILDRHASAHWLFARLLYDLGVLHRDDLVDLWWRAKGDG